MPVIVYSIIAIAGFGYVVGEPLRMTFFYWLPEWFVFNPDPRTLAASPMNIKVLISVLMILGMVLIGGITQELYSRGFLLPRIQYMGWAAPLYNAFLFTVFHIVSPWSWIPFFVMILPWSYLVWWKRSVKIGIFVHVGMLMIQWVLMSMLLFGLIPVPGGP